jgi:hypothetical protein
MSRPGGLSRHLRFTYWVLMGGRAMRVYRSGPAVQGLGTPEWGAELSGGFISF